MTDNRESVITPAMAPAVIESFPYGSLPVAGTAGRLARVTDRAARLWLDDGARWSPLAGNVVNVLSFGSFGSPDATTAAINAATYAASQSGASVYLPAATYTISGPLLFYAGQTIFGDGKSATVITTPGKTPLPVTMFQFASYPLPARDVMIRNLSIVNSTAWLPRSVGIDFTGIGFSRIERVSLNGHGTAIIGRDSALRTYVSAGSTGELLHVTATDTLYFGPVPIAIAIEGYQAPGGEAVLLYGNVTSVADPSEPDYPALAVTLTGSKPVVPLPPLTDIPVGAKVFHANRFYYGYYNSVADCDIANCIRGLSLTNDGDEWTVLDGQFRSNICGIYVEASAGNRFRTTFSSNGVGVEFGPRGVSNTVLAGSYFEGNGDLSRWADPATPKPAVLGAVRCHADPAGNANGNTVEPCALSNSTDVVVDETDGDNVCTSPHLRAFPAMPSGVGSGGNIVSNGDFAVFTQVSGIPDGWRANRPVPGTMSFAPENAAAKVPAGTTTALRWSMSHGQNEYFSIYRELAVIPGQWYTFTARTMVDPGGDKLYTLTLATAPSFSQDQELYYSGLMPAHDYNTGFHRHAFRVPDTVKSIYLILRNVNISPDPRNPYCEVTADSATAWFGKFHLEPGRGVSTESRDSGLMGHVQTSGGPLTIDARTASISVTHPYHTVAPGSGGVLRQIIPPAGFSGMIVLTATGAWTAATDAAGPGKIGTPLTMTAGKTVFGWYDTGTWWFTPA